MREIDERVVEMRFKNSNFEKNAKQTINTLDDLEKKIAFPNAKKNIEGLEKEFSKISFGALEKGIETVTLKFSALQIAGITAIQNITNKAINAGEALVKSLSIDQITAGFTKYEQKTTSVQTIVSATGKTVDEVNTALKKLNWFTDETSYNFTDMVDNIGKFTSAGVELDDAMSAMIGIANEAAVSGQNAASASRAMYNFAQAIGVGAVKLMDWKSIENANMATQEFKQTIIDAAVDLGTLTKAADGMYQVVGSKDKMVSVSNFNENLSESWFTSDVLIKSLKQYSGYAEEIYELQKKMGLDTAAEAMAIYSNEIETLGEKAFKAGQVAKTLTDAIDATKDAVSTQWMNTFEMIVGNLDQASELWTEFTEYLYDFFAKDLVNFNEFLEPVLATDSYDKLISELKELGVEEDQFGEIVRKTAKKYGIAIDEIIEREGSLGAAIRKHGFGSIIRESIDALAEGAEVTSTKVTDLTDKFEEYQKVVNDVIKGNYKNGIEARTKALADAGYEFSVIQPLVNKQLKQGKITVEDLKEVVGNLTEEELKNIGITKEQAEALKGLSNNLTKKSGRELIIDSFRNALKGVQKVISIIKEAWQEIFPPKTQEEIYAIIERFHDFSKNLILNGENADKLKRSLKGVFAALDIVKQIVFSMTRGGLQILGKLFGKTGLDVGELSASLGDSVVALRDWLNEGNKIGVFFDALTYSILHTKETIQGWFDNFLESHPNFSKWFDGLKAAFEQFQLATKDKWSLIIEDIKSGKIKDALSTVATYFLEFRDTVISYLTGIDFGSFVKDTGEGQFKSAQSILDSIKATFLGIVDAIKNAAIAVGGWIKTFVGNLNPMWFIPVMFFSVIIAIRNVSREIDILIRALKPLEEVKKAFINMLTTIGKSARKWFDAMAWERRSKTIVNLAIALGILAGSCWVLAQIPFHKLVVGVDAIILLTAALVGAEVIMVKYGKQGKGLARLTSAASALSGFVLIIVAAIKILETVNIVSAIVAIGELGAIFTGLIGFIVVLSLIKGELPKVNRTLITLAVTIGLISSSFLVLSLVPAEGLLTKVIAIGLVLGELLAVIAIMAKIQKKWKTAAKRTTSSLIGVVLALDLLVVSLKLIETVKVRDILEHLGSFISVFLMLDVLAKISSKVGSGGGGWQILALATGLLILVPAINSFSKLDGGALAKAAVAVGGLLFIESLIVKASAFAGQNSIKAGAMVLMISAAVAALSLVVWGFSALDFGALAQGTIAIGVILWIITQMIYASEKVEGGLGKMVALTAMVGIVSVAVIWLGNMDTDKALKAAGSLSLVFLSLTASLKLLEKSDGMNWKAMGQMAIFTVVGLPLIANVLEALNEMKTDGVIERATALSLVLLALSGASVILVRFGQTQNDKDLTGAWKTMGVLSLVLIELAVIGGILGQFKVDPDIMIKQFTALSTAIIMLEICALGMIGLAKVVEIAGGADSILKAMAGVAKIVALVGVIGFAVALIFGSIEEFAAMDGYSMNGLLEKGVQTMTLIGNAIGSLIGGLVGGIAGGGAEAYMSHLPAMGGYLSEFATALEPFLKAFGDLDKDVGSNIAAVTTAILELTAAEFLTNTDKFNDFLGFVFPIQGAKNAVDKLTGNDTPLKKMANGLKEFAESLKEPAKKFAEMKNEGMLDNLQDGIDISNKLVDVLNAIPSHSIFEDFFAGTISWTNLSSGLTEYGEAVVDYADWAILLTSKRKTAIENSIPVAEKLVELLNKLPTDEGLINDVFGSNKWSTLSSGLSDVGKAFFKYSEEIKSITDAGWNSIGKSVKPAKKLADVLSSLPTEEGLFNKIFGHNDWAVLSEGLSQLGTAMVTFGTTMSTFESGEGWGSTERAVPLLEKFVDSAKKITEMSGLGVIGETIDNAATQLGSGVGTFSDYFDKDEEEKANVGIRICSQLIALATTIKDNGIDGKNYLLNLGKDVNSYAQNMAAAARTLRSIDNEDFYEIAKYTLLGFTKGIQNNLGDVEKVMDNFVETVTGTTTGGLEIHSPSKFFEWVADMCGEGFAQNLESGYNKISDSVTGWVNNIKDSIDLDSITTMFSDFGVDLTSVIPGLSDLGVDFSKDLTFDYEKQIAEMQENIQNLTKEFGKSSDQVINAELELDNLKDEYKAYTKSRTENLEYYENKEYEAAQKQFDDLLEDYKAGRKTQMEFDNEYTQLLQKNTVKQAELFQYSAQKIQEYVSDSLDKVQEKFENQISDIQSKMDSTEDALNKTFDEQFKFKTNQDLYDEEISKYDESINKLNKQLEMSRKLYGENSVEVRHYQKLIDQLEDDRQKVTDSWEASGKDMGEIIAVEMTDEWEKQTKMAKETLEAVDSLKGRISEDMIDWLGTLEPEKLNMIATTWAKQSDEELKAIQKMYDDMKNANKELTKSLYSPEVEEAEKQYVSDLVTTYNELPDTAKAIGASYIKDMSNTFSEETNKTLATFEESGDEIISAIKQGMGFVETESKSKKMEEAGANIMKSLGYGIVNNKNELMDIMSMVIGDSVLEAIHNIDFKGMSEEIRKGFNLTIGDFKDDSGISVNPVVTSSSSTFGSKVTKRKFNTSGTTITAEKTSSSFNQRYEKQDNDTTSKNEGTRQGASFTQNIYSPKQLNRTEIRRDTKQFIELAASKF